MRHPLALIGVVLVLLIGGTAALVATSSNDDSSPAAAGSAGSRSGSGDAGAPSGVAPDSKFCQIADTNLDILSATAGLSDDPAELSATLRRSQQLWQDLADNAAPAAKAAFTAQANAIGRYYDALATIGFDLTKINDEIVRISVEALNESDATMPAASEYLREQCGLAFVPDATAPAGE